MRIKWIVTSLSALLVLALVVAPLAVAGKGPRVKNGVIHACLKTKGKKSLRGTIHVVNSPRQCKKKKGEQALTWALAGTTGSVGGTGTATEGGTGSQGATGPRGASGSPGTAGTAGATGEKGAQGEKGSAAAIEDTLKETILSQSKEIEILLGKIGTLGGELLDLEQGLGTVKTSVTDLGTNLNKSLGDVKTELDGTIGGVKTNLEGQIGGAKSNLEGQIGNLKTNVVDPLVAKVGLLEALEPLTDKVGALEDLPGTVGALTTSLAKLEPLTGNVKALNELPGKVTELATLPGEVNLLKGTTTSLTEAASSTCKQLALVGNGVNSLGTSLTGVTTHLTTVKVLGIPILELGEVPKTPETIQEPKCS